MNSVKFFKVNVTVVFCGVNLEFVLKVMFKHVKKKFDSIKILGSILFSRMINSSMSALGTLMFNS